GRPRRAPPLSLLRRVEAEPVRQPLPALRIKPDAGVTPEVPPDLGRHLEHDELISPGGEPALTSELAQLAGNRNQRISRRLIGQVIELGAGELQPRAMPGDFTPRNPQQQPMQPCQRFLPPRAGPRERAPPLRRVGIKPGNGGDVFRRGWAPSGPTAGPPRPPATPPRGRCRPGAIQQPEGLHPPGTRGRAPPGGAPGLSPAGGPPPPPRGPHPPAAPPPPRP